MHARYSERYAGHVPRQFHENSASRRNPITGDKDEVRRVRTAAGEQ